MGIPDGLPVNAGPSIWMMLVLVQAMKEKDAKK